MVFKNDKEMKQTYKGRLRTEHARGILILFTFESFAPPKFSENKVNPFIVPLLSITTDILVHRKSYVGRYTCRA